MSDNPLDGTKVKKSELDVVDTLRLNLLFNFNVFLTREDVKSESIPFIKELGVRLEEINNGNNSR